MNKRVLASSVAKAPGPTPTAYAHRRGWAANMKGVAFFLLVLVGLTSSVYASSINAATPTLVQNVKQNMWGFDTESFTSLQIPLLNPTLANNCVIVSVIAEGGAGAVTVTDDASGGSNTYTVSFR